MSYARKALKKAVPSYHVATNTVVPPDTVEALKTMSKTGSNSEEVRIVALLFIKESYASQYNQFLARFDRYLMGNQNEREDFLQNYGLSQDHICIKHMKET